MFVKVSDKLVINADHVTCISRDTERPKDVRISYTNASYTLIGMESAEAAQEVIAKIYERLTGKDS